MMMFLDVLYGRLFVLSLFNLVMFQMNRHTYCLNVYLRDMNLLSWLFSQFSRVVGINFAFHFRGLSMFSFQDLWTFCLYFMSVITVVFLLFMFRLCYMVAVQNRLYGRVVF
jgi:hypothetical protein